jgi:hypothetical protein
MFKQIKSGNVYLNSISGTIKRYEDEYGVFWYVYKEICSILLITERARTDIFNNWLNDDDTCIFSDLQTYGRYEDVQFISSDALCRLINRNNERANTILKDILNNENKSNDFQPTMIDKKIDKIISMKNQPGVPNYVDIFSEIREITEMDEYMIAMDKYRDDYDINIEKTVNAMRDKMYKNEIEWIIGGIDEKEMIKMKKENDIWENWFWNENPDEG